MTKPRYTAGEELANSLSHGIGILLGIIAGYFLLQKAGENTDPWAVGCVLTYLFGMLASYITSTLYHSSPAGKRREILRKADHSAIYWHIAGTYTPFALLVMRHAGYWGWAVFTFVWIAAIAGTIVSFRKLKEHSNVETICFVGMGSIILVALKPLSDCLQNTGTMSALWWLLGGGLSYVIGAFFYSLRKVKYMHFVFHLFILGGSACHIISIWITL
ncbi:hemolysin III family protein [uncultured Bacteroides sp.]|uniref:PAQR family membrane homeostasis protein TrhA n=1 Tax=uncultured Bacteroides sp. TaxID=162156 RepID=UPI002AA6E9D3|nr:hemolysin III family protein [uncultured Bacteroides sp.]